MVQDKNLQELRKLCLGTAIFPSEVITIIEEEKLWNIWVPKTYGGLELSFPEGLQLLKKLAKTDGSLGWTVTLCSGANFFIGNLKEDAAREIFLETKTPVLGGSGAVSGSAEKVGEHYLISGQWHYATGAPYLSHFTLSAKIQENGKQLKNNDGSPMVRSFIVPKDAVHIIEDWNTMGLQASVTHSFEVKEKMLHEKFSFIYNEVHLPQPIFKIDFSVFADLTLWVNYLGMAEHFAEEAQKHLSSKKLDDLEQVIAVSEERIFEIASGIEQGVGLGKTFTTDYNTEIHRQATDSVTNISRSIIELYPFLGLKASRENHPINQVFRDYFTATQHHIFTKK